MISVLIASRGDAAGLARTLSPLVAAAVEGVVRDAAVVHHRQDADCEALAEETGCSYRPVDALGDAVREARGEWLLLLEEGAVPGEGWTDAVRAFILAESGRGRFRRTGRGRGLVSLFRRHGALADGLLLPKREAATMARRAHSLEDLPTGRAARTIDAVLHRPE